MALSSVANASLQHLVRCTHKMPTTGLCGVAARHPCTGMGTGHYRDPPWPSAPPWMVAARGRSLATMLGRRALPGKPVGGHGVGPRGVPLAAATAGGERRQVPHGVAGCTWWGGRGSGQRGWSQWPPLRQCKASLHEAAAPQGARPNRAGPTFAPASLGGRRGPVLDGATPVHGWESRAPPCAGGAHHGGTPACGRGGEVVGLQAVALVCACVKLGPLRSGPLRESTA